MNRLAMLFLLLLFSIASTGYAKDKIIAVVNGELITEQEKSEFENVLKYKLSTQYNNPEEAYAKFMEAQEDSLVNLIEDRLILNEAKAQEYEIDESRIEKRLDEFRAQYPSEEIFYADLIKRGLSIDILRKKILDQILMKQVVAHKVSSQISVKPHEVTKFYKDNPEKFMLDQKVVYKAMVFNNVEDAQKASTTIKRAQRNGDLQMVLGQYEDSLRKGELDKSSVMEELSVLFDDINQVVYDPIKVGDDFYVFVVTDRSPEGKVSIAEAHTMISNYIYQKKYDEKFEEWLSELKEKAIVEFKEDK